MNGETRYRYEKRIRELEAKKAELEDKLYLYRTTVLDIYEGCVELVQKGSTSLSVGWVLGRIRRCLR